MNDHPHRREADKSAVKSISNSPWLDLLVKALVVFVVPYMIWNFNSNADTVKNLALNSAATIALSQRVDQALTYQDVRIRRNEVDIDKLNDKLTAIIQQPFGKH